MRRTAVLALEEESAFGTDARDIVQDLGYDFVQAADELDAESLCQTLAPSLVLTEPSVVYSRETIRKMSTGAELLVVLEPGSTVSARTVENWIHLAAPPREPGLLARHLQLLALARELQLPIHVEKQQLSGRIERKPLLALTTELAKARFTGRVELEAGSFFVASGEIIEARCRPVHGEKAFYRLVREVSGSFTVQPGPVVVDRRIRTTTAELVAVAIGEILAQHPPPDLRIAVNPARKEADLSGLQLKLLEMAARSPSLESILDSLPEADGTLLQEVVQLQHQQQILVDNPANSVRITTDATVDLPDAALESPMLDVFPARLSFSDGSAADRLEDPLAFYRHLRDGREAPQFEPLTVEGFLRPYRNLLPKRDIVSIHVSEGISPSKSHAFRAAQQILQSPATASYKRAPRLKVVDSKSAGLGTGLLVLFGTRMASRGKTADFIAQRLNRMSDRTITLYGVGDAGYFARHGGAKLGSSWRRSGGTPIVTIAAGRFESVAIVDTPHDIERRMTEILRSSLEPGTPLVVAIGHAAARQSGRLLRELIERDFDVLETVEGPIGPLVGRRTGPGAICATVFAPESEEIPWIQPSGDLQSDFQ